MKRERVELLGRRVEGLADAPIEVEEWAIRLLSLSVFFTESRLLVFFANVVPVVLAIIILEDIQISSGYLTLLLLCMFPYFVGTALVPIVYFGKRLNLTDKDFQIGLSKVRLRLTFRFLLANRKVLDGSAAVASATFNENASEYIQRAPMYPIQTENFNNNKEMQTELHDNFFINSETDSRLSDKCANLDGMAYSEFVRKKFIHHWAGISDSLDHNELLFYESLSQTSLSDPPDDWSVSLASADITEEDNDLSVMDSMSSF